VKIRAEGVPRGSLRGSSPLRQIVPETAWGVRRINEEDEMSLVVAVSTPDPVGSPTVPNFEHPPDGCPPGPIL
jgi:hypothetical protein